MMGLFSNSLSLMESCLLVVILLVTVAVVFLIRLLIQTRQLKEKLSVFPEMPDRHWLLGHMHKVTFDEKEYTWGTKMVNKLSHAAVMWVGPFLPMVTVFHHETIKAVLSTGEPKAEYTYSFVRPWIGDGLLLSSGKKWARNRRLLTPGFHFDILKPYVNVFQQSADILVDKWKLACNGETKSMEMLGDMSLLMLDSLLKCIFSVESNCQTVVNHPYIQGIYDIATLVVDRFRFLPFHSDFIYQWSPSGRRYRRAYESVHEYARNIIGKRKQMLAEEKAQGKTSQSKYVDFLDILLCAKDSDGKGLSDQEIYDEVDTFMFEGHDTTAAGVSWFLYNMARFPEFQQKCLEEIDELLQGRECDKFEWNDLNNLPYLTNCLKESLRFHPPVNLIMRKLTQPLTFPDGRTVPKDTFVTAAISGVHHNENVWDEPEVFDPDRFSPDRAKSIPPFAFVPFSAGPRNCIGQNFAMNEMKVIAAMILRNFNLAVNESIPVMRINSLVLRAEKGINLLITPRA
ncbi:cytochrome P450 4F22-like [Asterias rubens]|uniref:cytochrome P450 4F22-like n=1 Tax=Asterias rubens TaxID=7604 RepID=UPI001455CCB7|nr:cytochrome P450 4F22-like [Asterias rubens]XP_033629694.1 cytochrome P450 4F22-like [Asterias rubens]